MKKLWLAISLLVVLGFPLSAEATFSGLDLAADGRLLFKGTADVPGYGTYDTLFLARLGDSGVKDAAFSQLSFFPERVSYLGATGQLQIQNRFGIFRTGTDFSAPAPVANFPAFVAGDDIQTGRIYPVDTSPDGRYILFLTPVSSAYGSLSLLDTRNGSITLVSQRIGLSLSGPPVSWAPDSKYFVYEKDGTLYYYSIAHLQEQRVLSEDFRKIGHGSIRSIRWGAENDLYFLTSSLVYRIGSAEFFTRSLYSGFLDAGTVIGKIPFRFDPNFDSFWLSPDGTKILLDKGGQNLFLYYLRIDDYLSSGVSVKLPYLLLPRSTVVKDILWSSHDILTILTARIENGRSATRLYRLKLTAGGEAASFEAAADEGVQAVSLSPDESTVALVTADGIVLRNERSWAEENRIAFRQPLSVLWTPGENLIAAGAYTIELLNASTGESHFIAYSQVERYGFTGDDERIALDSNGAAMLYDPGSASYTASAEPALKKARTASDSYRVYLESRISDSYRNAVMVRNLEAMGTEPLFPMPEKHYEAFPERDETIDFSYFTHGSRIRRREVALVFNAIDSVEGLTEILGTLASYGVRATFFVNGEFIRRHPGAVKEIADSGHEVGSLFYSYFNMTDSRFRIDGGFIRKGLSRNEDDYYAVTGKELSLFWHAPYYFVNSSIITAAQELSYTYVGRDVDTLDWVSSSRTNGGGELYRPASDLVEYIMEQKKPGSILPIRIGRTEEGRDDYLFQKLDLLLNNLIVAGYGIVPVSTLMEHGR